MRLKNKNILIFLGVCIILIISMFFVLNNSHTYKELPKVKVKEPLKNKQFALMLEQDNGEYKESAGELPIAGYRFNKEKSGCVDINGKAINDILDYDYETNTVLLNTSKTSYCYLYYDKETIIEHLRNMDYKNQLTKEPVGGMCRYQGTDGVDNWICFGTSNQEECINNIDKYMYRIIGITPDEQLYLLKETFIKEENINGFVWNDEYLIEGSGLDVCKDGICPEWNESDLFQRINGTANGTIPGRGDANDGVDNDTDIFVDSTYYDYLKSGDKVNGGGNAEVNGEEAASEWYKLINIHSWYYGDARDASYDGDVLYNIETGISDKNYYIKNENGSITNQYNNLISKVDAKISLMYLHDYAYAYPGGKPGSYQNVKNSWIHFLKDGYASIGHREWLSTRWGILSPSDTSIYARYVDSDSKLNYAAGLNTGRIVRPVFYLTNAIKLSGSGTKENPFMIN